MSARQNWEIDSTNDVLVNSTYNFRLRAALINYFSGNINLALNFSKIRNIANIIFCNGLGLEHGPSLRNLLSESPKVISLGDLLKEKHPELFFETLNH